MADWADEIAIPFGAVPKSIAGKPRLVFTRIVAGPFSYGVSKSGKYVVLGWSGGASGAACSWSSNAVAASGGGAGAFGERTYTCKAGDVISGTVGAGGVVRTLGAGVGIASGYAGDSTTVSVTDQTTMTLSGGAAGNSGNNTSAGSASGGTATNADISSSGGSSPAAASGGFSSGGSAPNDPSEPSLAGGTGGAGSATTASAGSFPGGGGGGASNTGGSTATSGAGGSGAVYVLRLG